MKFVLAPDSFKESMPAKMAALAIEKGIRRIFPEADCILVPLADGGEGTVDLLVSTTKGKFIEKEVTGPVHNKVKAKYGILGDGETAVIEMASASGIHLVKREERNPLITTTYGTGELIRDALNRNVRRIIVGLGGSATNDGGSGMLQALGVSLKDENGKELSFGGGALNRLSTIDMSNLDPRLRAVDIIAACDVDNPLIGKDGASRVFAPQKGASPEMVETLEENLTCFAEVIHKQLKRDIKYEKGAGAAGGLGAGLMAFLNARFKNGIEVMIEYTDLKSIIEDADFVFTGEGSIDGQTLFGKTVLGVSTLAKKYDVPVVVFAGNVRDTDQLYLQGVTACFGIVREVSSYDQVLKSGSENLTHTVENVCRLLKLMQR